MARRLVKLYACPACHVWKRREYDDPAPICCNTPMKWQRTTTYDENDRSFTGMQAPAIDFHPSRAIDVPIEDGHGGQIQLEGLHHARQIERESAARAANGEGQEMRFRCYANDGAEGLTRNSFGASPARTPKLTRGARQIISGGALTGAAADADTLGPGTDPAHVSALPEAP